MEKKRIIGEKRTIPNGKNNIIKHLVLKEGENIEDKDFDEYDYIIDDKTMTDTEKYQMIGKLWFQKRKDKLKSWFKREKKI